MVNYLDIAVYVLSCQSFLFFFGIFSVCSTSYDNNYSLKGYAQIFLELFYKQSAYYVLMHPETGKVAYDYGYGVIGCDKLLKGL